jgi:hypothetical protein
MNKGKHYRETRGYVQYNSTQSLGEVLTRHQRTVGESRYGQCRGHACEAQGPSHAPHRPKRNGGLVEYQAGPVSAQPRMASHGKSMRINEV